MVSLMSPLAYMASAFAVMAWVPAASAIVLAVLPLPPPLVPARYSRLASVIAAGGSAQHDGVALVQVIPLLWTWERRR